MCRPQHRVVLLLALASGSALALAPRPVTRSVHVELFRYGSEPCVIRANRGDRLVLTFSSRDTGHSFFLQEYDLDVKVTPGADQVEVFRPSQPQTAAQRCRQVELIAGQPGLVGLLSSKARFRCHVYCGPLHGFEQGDLVVAPNLLLWLGLVVLLVLPPVAWVRARRAAAALAVCEARGADLFGRWPWLGRLFAHPRLRPSLMTPMAAALYLLILTGLVGTKMAGRNLATMLVWVLWLFVLVVLLTPVGSRLWCLACPLPWLGDWFGAKSGGRPGQGGGRPEPSAVGPAESATVPARRRGARLLGVWTQTLLFLGLCTFSMLLAGVPRLTSTVLFLLTALALAAAVAGGARAFCRDLCPLNAFIGLYSMVGRLALRPAKASVCRDCRVSTCRQGNARGEPCPYGERLIDLNTNRECVLCGECLRTCAHGNVAWRWRAFAEDAGVAGPAEAIQALVLLVVGMTYCLVHLGPWPEVRAWLDLVDRRRWLAFAAYAAALWVTALLLMPAVVLLLAAWGRHWQRPGAALRDCFLANAAALVPLGYSVWLAFALAPFMTHATFVLATVSDPFGWNWDLFGMASHPWRQLLPGAIPWLQTVAVLAGVYYALRNGWRGWAGLGAGVRPPRTACGFLPQAASILAVGGGLIRLFAG